MRGSSIYRRYLKFYDTWGGLLLMVMGTVLVCVSALLAVVAIEVSNQNSERGAEAHLACLRSKQFGVPFLEFFEITQERLRFEALPEKVLEQYKKTIPKSCP